MRRFVVILAALAAVAGGFVMLWRRNPRVGTSFMNSAVNPLLLRRGLSGVGRSEIGTLEHRGRVSGVLRLTPVHPEPTPEGFRIMVPLGEHSEWAHNVMAAGHCRMQLHGLVYDLDEPALIPASDVEDLPAPARRVMSELGFEYLTLRTFKVNPGTLAVEEQTEPATEAPAAEEVATGSEAVEPVSATA